MKRLLLVAAACVAMNAQGLWAQDVKVESKAEVKAEVKDSKVQLKADGDKKEARKGMDPFHAEMIKVLVLPEDQAKKLEDLLAARRKSLAELDAARAEIVDKGQADVMNLLTPEQKATWYVHLAIKTMEGRFKAANLTPDQITKIKAAWVEVSKGVNLADDKARQEAYKKLNVKVEELLTAEQQAAMKPAKPVKTNADKPGEKPAKVDKPVEKAAEKPAGK